MLTSFKHLIKKVLRLNNQRVVNLIDLLKHKKVDLVLDVGANKGQYAQSLFNKGYEGTIVSFEPLSTAYSVLLKQSKKNKKWIVEKKCALGDFKGKIKINISENSYSSSLLPMLDSHIKSAPNSKYVDFETVNLFKLDNLIKTPKLMNPN